jgi:hypothetical protein
MRCKTCRGDVRFIQGAWRHLKNTKCGPVVVDWPSPLIRDDD